VDFDRSTVWIDVLRMGESLQDEDVDDVKWRKEHKSEIQFGLKILAGLGLADSVPLRAERLALEKLHGLQIRFIRPVDREHYVVERHYSAQECRGREIPAAGDDQVFRQILWRCSLQAPAGGSELRLNR
jgi:hypothetical protein